MKDLSILEGFSEDVLEEYLAKKKENKRIESERKRKAYEEIRDETIVSLCTGALSLQQTIIDFKSKALSDMNTVYDLLLEYSSRYKEEGKGNFSIEKDDFRIVYRNATLMKYDERANTGKRHILDFVEKRWEGDDETRNLILTLLNEQASGDLNARDVNKLIKMENSFDDVNWREGIKLLKESYNEVATKSYIRFYTKDGQGEFKPIVLNFASLEV